MHERPPETDQGLDVCLRPTFVAAAASERANATALAERVLPPAAALKHFALLAQLELLELGLEAFRPW